MRGYDATHIDMIARTAVDILDHLSHHLVQVLRLQLGLGANLAEPLGNALQTLHVLTHLWEQRIVGVRLAQHLLPGHQATDGGAQLMGSLFAQAHPYLVLLCFLA